tara:strand:+ start:1722 stop:1877 length:156 start_codon:yes stop_codon:yes gene_type:complete
MRHFEGNIDFSLMEKCVNWYKIIKIVKLDLDDIGTIIKYRIHNTYKAELGG